MYGSAYNSLCVGSERDPKKHSAMKRNLSAAFSTQALLEQEDIIQSCVDGFVEKIGSVEKSRSRGLNMTHWYEMVSFDLLGEMAFGESFHAVQDGSFHIPERVWRGRRLTLKRQTTFLVANVDVPSLFHHST